jgi:hypothetical protein
MVEILSISMMIADAMMPICPTGPCRCSFLHLMMRSGVWVPQRRAMPYEHRARRVGSRGLTALSPTPDYKDSCSFYVNGKKHVVHNPPPSLHLATYLRETLHLTGTKVGVRVCGYSIYNRTFHGGTHLPGLFPPPPTTHHTQSSSRATDHHDTPVGRSVAGRGDAAHAQSCWEPTTLLRARRSGRPSTRASGPSARWTARRSSRSKVRGGGCAPVKVYMRWVPLAVLYARCL